jgi:hypothetical protein
VPADPSSPIPAALTRLAPTDPLELQDAEAPHLLAYLAAVPDPRAARGRRHRLVAILALAAAAVLAGARSIGAIAEWAADRPQPIRTAFGARRDALDHIAVPAEATIRRTLARLDADALAAAIGAWLAGSECVPDPRPPGGGRSPSTARPCAAPAPAPPTVTAARRTCWRRWTTPPARCWPYARSAARPRRSPPSPRCWPHST